MQFSIGCDPEILVTDGIIPRSVIGKVGGTKEAPMPLPLGDGFAVQEDNVALEFNIPPSHSKAEFVSNLVKATGFLEAQICAPYGWTFDKRSAISFAMEELDDPRAFVFGCDPDYNAWTGRVNPRPHSDDRALRSAGGHVHIGCKSLGVKPREVIRACDLYLGVPSVLMDNGELRKQLYGKAGAYRVKPFGVEYRTLSNFWIFDEKLVGWVYDNTERALVAALEKTPIIQDRDLILQAINLNDKAAAKLLVDKYQLEVV
jgi:Phage phiEco32-like COOH.NH2 ligase-type 2